MPSCPYDSGECRANSSSNSSIESVGGTHAAGGAGASLAGEREASPLAVAIEVTTLAAPFFVSELTRSSLACVCSCTRATKSGALSTSSGTTITPRSAQPKKAATHSGPFAAQKSTRSPFSTPRASNSRANLYAVFATRA